MYSPMKLQLLTCDALRPNKRAIANGISEIAGIPISQANLLTDILLEGDAVDIEINDAQTATSLRALRKLQIDYKIVA